MLGAVAISSRIAFAASREFLDLDEEWPFVRDALARRAISAEIVMWNDPSADWSRFAGVVVNYAWGYISDRNGFLDFAEALARTTPVLNPPEALRWNSAKTYLAELEQAGLAIIPTTFLAPGDPFRAPADEFVIKPAVSSGGTGAARYREPEPGVAEAHVARLHAAGQDVLVQPYQHGIDEAGETALLYLDGEYSHAITKHAILEADGGEPERLWERTRHVPTTARADQRELADAALAEAGRYGELCYGRVDLVDDADGKPQILEVEIIEPRLFFPDAVAAQRFADAIARRVGASVA